MERKGEEKVGKGRNIEKGGERTAVRTEKRKKKVKRKQRHKGRGKGDKNGEGGRPKPSFARCAQLLCRYPFAKVLQLFFKTSLGTGLTLIR